MKSGLPSLNVLVVFDAAAKTLSFKKAAEELHISPPAVSHQIRVLEKELGVSLFKRLNRTIELSEEGYSYYREISPALAQIRGATGKLLVQGKRTRFSISSIPFIANSLLIPNIQQFMKLYPELRVDIQSQFESAEGIEKSIAVGVRHHNGGEPDLLYQTITRILISPVCSRAYLEQKGGIELSDIFKHRLIKMPSDSRVWPIWSNEYGIVPIEDDVLMVDNYQSIMNAAAQGLGIAMGYFPMLTETASSDSIVPIFQDKYCEFGNLYLVCRKQDQEKLEVTEFKKWLVSLFDAL